MRSLGQTGGGMACSAELVFPGAGHTGPFSNDCPAALVGFILGAAGSTAVGLPAAGDARRFQTVP